MSVSTGIRVSLIVVILLIELYLTLKAPSNRGAGATGAASPPPTLCSRGQLCPFLKAIELFYHPNNFASDVRNVINQSELIVVGRHWLPGLPGYYILFVHIISYFH
jgi:hypothetical protein